MKKLMSLLVLASVSMFVLGCGEGDKKKADTTKKAAADTTTKEKADK